MNHCLVVADIFLLWADPDMACKGFIRKIARLIFVIYACGNNAVRIGIGSNLLIICAAHEKRIVPFHVFVRIRERFAKTLHCHFRQMCIGEMCVMGD